MPLIRELSWVAVGPKSSWRQMWDSRKKKCEWTLNKIRSHWSTMSDVIVKGANITYQEEEVSTVKVIFRVRGEARTPLCMAPVFALRLGHN